LERPRCNKSTTLTLQDLGNALQLATVRGEIFHSGFDSEQAANMGLDRGRSELSEYIIKLQHTIIILITESNTSTGIVIPSLPNVLATSDETRWGVITALGQQYQRMAQSQQIGNNPSPTITLPPWDTLLTSRPILTTSAATTPIPKRTPGYCHGLEEVSYADFSRCSTCNYEGNLGHWFLLKVRTKDKVSAAISLEAIWDWHLPVAAVVNVRNAWFGCKCCDHRYYGGQERFEVTIDGLEGEMGLGTHIGSVHYITDLQKLLSNGVGVVRARLS
jgi:hypothetical protein